MRRTLILPALAALHPACGPSAAGCADHRQARLPSPDGRHVAVLFERGCGATTDIGTYVAVLPATDSLRQDEWPPLAFAYDHRAPIVIRWRGADTLTVVRREDIARAGRAWEHVGGVRVVHLDAPRRGLLDDAGGLTLR